MPVYPARALERAMKISEVITRAISGKINWIQAAEILGMSDRQLRRWRNSWNKYGYGGLFDLVERICFSLRYQTKRKHPFFDESVNEALRIREHLDAKALATVSCGISRVRLGGGQLLYFGFTAACGCRRHPRWDHQSILCRMPQ
jgi:hypothetical protein